MVRVFPFHGIHYNKKKVKNLAKVMAPPYDVISPAEQENFYTQSEYSAIRLILGKDFPGDNEFNNRYVRAATFLRGWLQHNILIQDEKPSLYIYEQRFFYKGKKFLRLGFISLLRLEEFGKGKVYPHEETLSKPKLDRLELMKSTQANLESIFAIYADEKQSLSKYIKKLTKKAPLINIVDKDKIRHRVWAINQKPAIAKVIKEMKDKIVFIADGHHRYEAAMRYRNMMKSHSQKFCEDELYNHIMIYFTNIEAKGLLVLPIHRLIKTPPPIAFEHQLEEYFNINVFEFSKKTEKRQRKKFFKLLQKIGKEGHVFGMYLKNVSRYFILTLKDEKLVDEFVEEDKPKAWKYLDVTILQSLVIDHLLGLKLGTSILEENIAFFKNEDEGIDKVNNGDYHIAFFLNPTKVEDIINIANKFEKMPQKSTYFYPKLLSGLLMSKICPDDKILP